MGTITFEVHLITPTSPRNTLATKFKSILVLFAFDFLCIFFSLEHIMHGHIRERKVIPDDVKLLTLHFCYAKVYKCHFIIGKQQWGDDYLCLSPRIF